MKKILFTMLMMMSVGFIFAQSTYYWVGGVVATPGSSTGRLNDNNNWNRTLGGAIGADPRTSTSADDILVFDGSNLGGGATGIAET